MSYWRNAGLSYLRYSAIAARQVRASLKKEVKGDPQRETSTIKLTVNKAAAPKASTA